MSRHFTRSVLLLAAIAALPGMLFAETVMAWVDGPPMSRRDLVLSAVEAGFMDTLFDAGHIVFSAGLVEDDFENDMQRQYVATRMARDGGARLLVMVSAEFTPTDAGGIDFTVIDIGAGSVLQQERVPVPVDLTVSPEARAYSAGVQTADLVLMHSVGAASW